MTPPYAAARAMTPPDQLVRPADVLLRDGTVAVVRSATPDDIAALERLHAGLSADNLRRRFFGAGPRLASDYLHHLAMSPQTVALVAERAGRLVALGTAEPAGEGCAEVAFVVADECHGLGLGSLLLEHLAAVARDHGVRRFVAEILPDNHEMLEVLSDAGFSDSMRIDAGTVRLELDTSLTGAALAAADARERVAEAESLRPLLHPGSVTVVGARRDGTGVGAAVIGSILRGGYPGRLDVVHPGVRSILGVRAWPTVAAVPHPVDLAIVAVPARSVLGTVEAAASAGVRAAVILSSGFEALGAEGRRTQQEILAAARRSSMRVVGPNCLGLLCNGIDERFDATFGDDAPLPGGLAVASQSGGVGIALLDAAGSLSLGLRYFVSLGDKLDVSSNDLLAAWTDDDHVSAAALYLESFGNPLKFARVARRFAESKPLLGILGGRSPAGTRAGAAHTNARATPAVEVDALFAQAGVIRCEDADDMAEAALMLTTQPLPRGRRVGVLSNAAGMGVLAADAAYRHSLEVPELSPRLQARLAPRTDEVAGVANPVDAGAGVSPDDLAALAETLVTSDEIDALLVAVVPTRVTDGPGVLRRLVELAGRQHDKPMAIVPVGSLWDLARPAGTAAYRTIEAALGALARAAVYADWRRHPAEEVAPPDPARATAARERLAPFADEVQGDGWLPPDAVDALLQPYGLGPVGVARDNDLEATVDIVRAAHVGPLLTIAASAEADAPDGRVVLIPPIGRGGVCRAVGSLRVLARLRDHGGTAAAGVAALVDIVEHAAQLAEEVPAVARLELRAVCDGDGGCTVAGARLRTAPPTPLDAGVPRRLRDRDGSIGPGASGP